MIGRVKSSSSKKNTWSKCHSCKGGRQYSSATKALEHLHKHHFDCSGKTHQPYDDPCYVWLRHIQDSTCSRQLVSGINAEQVEDFVSRLLPICSYARELHSLVAGTQSNSANARPPLPSTIGKAFEHIMAVYVIRAQWLSLNNRRNLAASNTEAIQFKIEELMVEEDSSTRKVYDYLQDAKKDIILLKGTSRHVDGLGVEAVGAEFLVMALMANLQTRPVLGKAASTAPDRADFIELYQKYTSQLRFKANRRPKKRVFLDIHGLEEELDALYSMIEAQMNLMRKYLRLIAPRSTRITNPTRVGLYKVESGYGRAQQSALRSKYDTIETLKEKSEVLKEQVKKTIEVLEEDHGKAIRVFTFVTLLFLPLSFVTSFMGMNTTDIRDTEFSQTIFWMTGLPVTVVVITLAVIYAYRGEAVEDWIWRQMQPKTPGRTEAEGAGMGSREKPGTSGMIHVDSALAQTHGQHGRDDQTDVDRGTWVSRKLLRRHKKEGQSPRAPRRATTGSTGLSTV